MMREILFRGKDIDNGIFVTGYLIGNETGKKYITLVGSHCKEVIPETVEQCSGVPDKNGKLMFEGDVVNALFDFGMPIKSVCAFRDGSFGLLAKQHGAEHFHPFTSLCNISYEIIGNIHDDKELLDWSNME